MLKHDRALSGVLIQACVRLQGYREEPPMLGVLYLDSQVVGESIFHDSKNYLGSMVNDICRGSC